MEQLKRDEKGNITLLLEGEGKARAVGTVKDGVLRTKRKRGQHLMKIYGNAYGVNKQTLDTMDDIKDVQITDEFDTYVVPKAVYQEALDAKPLRYDRQYFLPIDIIQRYKKS